MALLGKCYGKRLHKGDRFQMRVMAGKTILLSGKGFTFNAETSKLNGRIGLSSQGIPACELLVRFL